MLALQLKRVLERELDVEVPLALLCDVTLGEVAAVLAAGLGGTRAGRGGGSP